MIGRAGAFVTLDRYGALAVYRGCVRPEDEPAVQDGTDAAVAGQGADRDLTDDHAGAIKLLPERLVMELAATGGWRCVKESGASPTWS